MFSQRHIGPSEEEQKKMLGDLDLTNLDELVRKIVPDSILYREKTTLPKGCDEYKALSELKNIAQANKPKPSLIGQGYYNTVTPSVIKRNVLENPAWYTSYTPYQAEISQGRLESLFNFQTLVTELTGLSIANASLLDEGTAAAEAMTLAYNSSKRNTFLVDSRVFFSTLQVLQTRAEPLGISIVTVDLDVPIPLGEFEDAFGFLIQMPNSEGKIKEPSGILRVCDVHNIVKIAVVDPMAQVLMQPVGEMGFDIAVGSMQRFGIPMGFGGPHAAFFATTDKYKRKIPGRIVGQSKDSEGNLALRLALQTREQHIRRDKATSNICTAQALLANMSAFYAIYHGPEGLKKIARRIWLLRQTLLRALKWSGIQVDDTEGFDTIRFKSINMVDGYNVTIKNGWTTLSLDETSTFDTLYDILNSQVTFDSNKSTIISVWDGVVDDKWKQIPMRTKPWLQQEVFHKYRSETNLMRYIRELENKDFSLVHGMMPLGSCTMKLNSAAELTPVSWEEFANVHPHTPGGQVLGYDRIIKDLSEWLCDITGFHSMTFQPNSGAQGEYAGLLAIREYHESRADFKRNVCLIPESAHGTNPASAVMAGMKVVGIKCDSNGNVDIHDLRVKACLETDNLAALMITYPSTHGVFEQSIKEICSIVHEFGGQVYMDGANFNAQVGLCQPGEFGVDVSHLNLHKTFCIPHGGGGPGVGPIGVAEHLAPFIDQKVSSAEHGSASILPIVWMYMRMMGEEGLRNATEIALLNANWLAKKIDPHFKVLYKGQGDWVAHECIFDCRNLGVTAEDIAKRLMDYGFHAPTLSWPVLGTMMVEPTESESLDELQRFVDAMVKIRKEIIDRPSIVKNAPHTQSEVCGQWTHSYTREEACFPNQPKQKFWPAVGRIDNVYGDRNLVCSCTVDINT
jgi:glycine dehydrogenase